jgi:hypothetical protein
MQRRNFVITSALASLGLAARGLPFGGVKPLVAGMTADASRQFATRKILIAGGNYGEAFIRYMAELTGKPRPRICYLPTASADSANGTISFYKSCASLNVSPFVQASFIESNTQTKG